MNYKVIKHKRSGQYIHFIAQPTSINLSNMPMLYPSDTKLDNLRILFLDHEITWDWNNFIMNDVELKDIS
jgi:hypothetical protein